MLTLWKRHSATCKKVHEKEFKSLGPAQHRFFKKCQCACQVTGVHPITGQYLKKSLNVTSWEAGEKLKAELEGQVPGATKAKNITIAKALEEWIDDKARIGVSASTRGAIYRTLEVCLLDFAKDYGIILMCQWDVQAARELIKSPHWRKWKMSTANRQLTNLRAFFKYAVGCEWIEKNPALGIARGADDSEMIDPFTPEESDHLEEAFANWAKAPGAREGQWNSHPATLCCLKNVLRDSGLRISDALQARPAVIRVLPNGDGEWTLMQCKKDGKWTRKHGEVTVYFSRATLAQMKSVPWISEKYPFMLEPRKPETDRDAFKKHLHLEGIKVWAAMQKIGELAGVKDCRPHRFRHSFAEKMWLNGKSLEKIARYLGHKDTRTLQAHYGKWTDQRQEVLRDERLRDFGIEHTVQSITDARKVG